MILLPVVTALLHLGEQVSTTTTDVTTLAAPSVLVVDRNNASAAELYAASTLSQYLTAAVGRPVPVISTEEARSNRSSPVHAGVRVYVGYHAAVELGKVPAARLLALAGEAGRGDDAFIIAAAMAAGSPTTGHVALASAPTSVRGTANAAFEFLRSSCGFHFLAPAATAAPQKPLRSINVTGRVVLDPLFVLRDTTEVEGMLYAAWGRDRTDEIKRVAVLGNFSQAVGLNGRFAHGPVPNEMVGPHFRVMMASGNTSDGYAHTAYELLSPTGSAKDCGLVGDAAQTSPCSSLVTAHPDWFVCRENQGDDVPLTRPLSPNFTSVTYPCTPQLAAMEYSSHLCWSLPAVHKALEVGVRRVLAADPRGRYIAVEIMDGFAISCPADMAAVKEAGSFAGPVLGALSAVAAALERDFPDVKIVTIACECECCWFHHVVLSLTKRCCAQTIPRQHFCRPRVETSSPMDCTKM
jgi:hypothetical protein